MKYVIKTLLEFEAVDDVEARAIARTFVENFDVPNISTQPWSNGHVLTLREHIIRKDGNPHIILCSPEKVQEK